MWQTQYWGKTWKNELVNKILCKSEDLSSDPQYPCRKHLPYMPSIGEVEKGRSKGLVGQLLLPVCELWINKRSCLVKYSGK